MGKDKAGGRGMEDQPGSMREGAVMAKQSQPSSKRKDSRVMFWGHTAPTLGTNSAEGEPVCCKAVLAG